MDHQDQPSATDLGLDEGLVDRIKRHGHVRESAGPDVLFGIDYVLEEDGTISELNDIGGAVSRFAADGSYMGLEHQETNYKGRGLEIAYGLTNKG